MSSSEINKTKYLVKDSILYVGYIIEISKLDKIISAKTETQQPQIQSFK